MALKKITVSAALAVLTVAASVTVFMCFDSSALKTAVAEEPSPAETQDSSLPEEEVTVTTTTTPAVTTVTAVSTTSSTGGTTATTSVTTAASKTTTAATTKKTAKKTAKKTTAEVPEAAQQVTEKAETVAAEVKTAASTTAKKKTTTKAASATKATTTTAKATSTTPPALRETEVESSRKVINYQTQKAMWVTLFDLNRMLEGRSEAQFKESFGKLCSDSKALGINTLYVHARALGDAFYQSSWYPWSAFASGTVGVSPGFDPFKTVTECAHTFGLSVHAWINPYRCGTPEQMEQMPEGYLIKKWYDDPDKYPEYISYAPDYGKYWLNPGIPAVRELIARGVEELVSNYDIDGVHIDDYFYPTTETWFDAAAYQKYGSGMTLSQWRLFNCTATVKYMYDCVKAADPSLVFGIAPQGNYENNYAYMYADVSLWLSQAGYCDYVAPQIYFGYNNRWKPFASTLAQWAALPRDKSVTLVIGIAAANMELDDEYYNDVGIISKQIRDSLTSADGIALYSYASLFTPGSGYEDRAASERVYVKKALQ